MAVQVKRIFQVSDGVLVSKATAFSSLLTTRFPEFAAFDPEKFHPTFQADFTASIELASATPQDRDVLRHQVEDTMEMMSAKTEAVAAYNQLGYFVDKLGADDPAKPIVFGLPEFSELCRGPVEKLILFFENIINTITEHLPELTAAQYSPAMRQRYTSAVSALRIAKANQESAIRMRSLMTMDRVEVMNHVWLRMTEISKAAEQVYAGNPDAIELFALPTVQSSSKKDPKPDHD